MKSLRIRTIGLMAIGLMALSAVAYALQGDSRILKANLNGFQETPSISTTGEGTFRARLHPQGAGAIEYELSYDGLQGVAMFAHIHLGQRSVAGGVSAFLCGGGGKPPCPPSGTVTGVITAADVTGPVNQGIAPGEIGELIRAMRA